MVYTSQNVRDYSWGTSQHTKTEQNNSELFSVKYYSMLPQNREASRQTTGAFNQELQTVDKLRIGLKKEKKLIFLVGTSFKGNLYKKKKTIVREVNLVHQKILCDNSFETLYLPKYLAIKKKL